MGKQCRPIEHSVAQQIHRVGQGRLAQAQTGHQALHLQMGQRRCTGIGRVHHGHGGQHLHAMQRRGVLGQHLSQQGGLRMAAVQNHAGIRV